uniref:Transporter n=1 Tax=Macrostomum lignano TaxID=282301 RepID=A0A1I8FLU8_9PLAT
LRGTLLGSNQLANDGHVDDENQERGNWSGRLDFFLSCLGYAVGLGNVWRFPYLCYYKNGGGAFFIPYCIFLFLCGMPVFCMELAIGQFSSSGRFSPAGSAHLCFAVGHYGICLLRLAIPLPWAPSGGQLEHPSDANGTAESYLYGIYNASLGQNYMEFFLRRPARQAGQFPSHGPLRWDMSLCLLLAWIIVFLSLSKGIKSSGKVVYFTALFPYAVLIIAAHQRCHLPGCGNGLEFYLTPNVTKLSESGVWKDAAVQIFSLCPAAGAASSLCYNRFKTDCIRDGMLISICNCATSVFAGFVVFSFLVYLAQELNTNVKDVAQSGVGLAFIVRRVMKASRLHILGAILFFLMLITLGLDSQFTFVETAVTSILDRWPHLRRYKTLMIMDILHRVFFLGFVNVHPPRLLTVFDDYSESWNVMVITILLSASALAMSMEYEDSSKGRRAK